MIDRHPPLLGHAFAFALHIYFKALPRRERDIGRSERKGLSHAYILVQSLIHTKAVVLRVPSNVLFTGGRRQGNRMPAQSERRRPAGATDGWTRPFLEGLPL